MGIMHIVIETNVILKEIVVTDSNQCSFCLIAKDTIQHIFGECPLRTQFWTQFLIILNINFFF